MTTGAGEEALGFSWAAVAVAVVGMAAAMAAAVLCVWRRRNPPSMEAQLNQRVDLDARPRFQVPSSHSHRNPIAIPSHSHRIASHRWAVLGQYRTALETRVALEDYMQRRAFAPRSVSGSAAHAWADGPLVELGRLRLRRCCCRMPVRLRVHRHGLPWPSSTTRARAGWPHPVARPIRRRPGRHAVQLQAGHLHQLRGGGGSAPANVRRSRSAHRPLSHTHPHISHPSEARPTPGTWHPAHCRAQTALTSFGFAARAAVITELSLPVALRELLYAQKHRRQDEELEALAFEELENLVVQVLRRSAGLQPAPASNPSSPPVPQGNDVPKLPDSMTFFKPSLMRLLTDELLGADDLQDVPVRVFSPPLPPRLAARGSLARH